MPVATGWAPPVTTSVARPILEAPVMRWRGISAARRVRDTLARRCRGASMELPSEDYFDRGYWAEDENWTEIGADVFGAHGLLFRSYWFGQGVESDHGMAATLHDLKACTSATMQVQYLDAGLTGSVTGRPETVLAAVIGPRLDPGDPAHGYATLLTTARGVCEPAEPPDMDEAPVAGAPTFALAALPFSEQRWFSGAPPRQTRVWKEVDEVGDDGVGARVIEAPKQARLLHRAGDLQVFGADLPGRNGGLALALYDQAGDRHRWLVATRGCLMGTRIYWLAAGSGVVIGYALSDHPVYKAEGRDGLFVIDAVNPRVYRLLLDGSARVWADADGDDEWDPLEPRAGHVGRFRVDEATLRTRCGSRVALADIRAALDARASGAM